MNAAAPGPAALYETLARFQWWRSAPARRRGLGQGLEMRKRLLPPRPGADGPSDGCAGFDAWLFAALEGRPVARVVDLGCGFGASTLRWAAFRGGVATGVTSSAFQVARAREQAVRHGLGDRVRFLQQDFTTPLDAGNDVVLAIEALGHACDLDAVLANVHAALRPGGTFVWVEDLLCAPLPDDADVRELATAWASPTLRDRATTRAALERAGFVVRRECDLSAQVPIGAAPQAARQRRRWSAVRHLLPLPAVRRLADAFVGGLALERLYAQKAACYLVRMCERPPEAA